MADEPQLATVLELPQPAKVRRCSACHQPGHRSDSASCPKALDRPLERPARTRRPVVDPGPLVDRLTQEINGLDTYIADHELALHTIEQRLADATRRREQLVRALEAANTLDSLFKKEVPHGSSDGGLLGPGEGG